jgi:hypothetical protein
MTRLAYQETKDFNTTLLQFIDNIMYLKVEGFLTICILSFLNS